MMLKGKAEDPVESSAFRLLCKGMRALAYFVSSSFPFRLITVMAPKSVHRNTAEIAAIAFMTSALLFRGFRQKTLKEIEKFPGISPLPRI